MLVVHLHRSKDRFNSQRPTSRDKALHPGPLGNTFQRSPGEMQRTQLKDWLMLVDLASLSTSTLIMKTLELE